MGNFYNDDDEFNKSQRVFSTPVIATTAAVSGVILVILLIVLSVNNTNSGRNNLRNSMYRATPTPEALVSAVDLATNYQDQYGNKDIEKLYKDGKLRAEDFDFWNMYDSDHSKVITVSAAPSESESADPSGSPSPSGSPYASDSPSPSESPSPEPEEDKLIPGVKENTVEFKNLKSINSQMGYYVNGEKVSKLGVEISENAGIVDFNALKNNGVDFVLLKVGGRGYDSGLITKDSNFDQNIRAASSASLGIGLYFTSRAVTVDEATQEAEFCIDNAIGYSVDYPIAFVFEGEVFDTARTDYLNKEDRTKMAETFLNTIRTHGYTPALYGNQEYILESIIPDHILTDFDVILYDLRSIPEYPYQYKLWKYVNNVAIPGVEKGASYIVSFVDYKGR